MPKVNFFWPAPGSKASSVVSPENAVPMNGVISQSAAEARDGVRRVRARMTVTQDKRAQACVLEHEEGHRIQHAPAAGQERTQTGDAFEGRRGHRCDTPDRDSGGE